MRHAGSAIRRLTIINPGANLPRVFHRARSGTSNQVMLDRKHRQFDTG